MKVFLCNTNGESLEINTNYSSTFRLNQDLTGIESTSYSHSSEQSPFQDGLQYYDTYANAREISFSFLIQATSYSDMWLTSKRRDIIRVLNAKNGLLTFRLELDDGTQYDINGSIQGIPTIKSAGYKPKDAICNIDLICFDPWFRNANKNMNILSLSTGGFTLPFSLPLNLGTYGCDTITNNGDVASSVLITINGPATNPTIENETTGEKIDITKAIVVGEKIVIDTDVNTPFVKYIETDGTESVLFNAVDIDSEFFQLQPGSNVIKLLDTEDLTGSTFIFSWFDKYSGV